MITGILRNKVLTSLLILICGFLYAGYEYMNFIEGTMQQGEIEIKNLNEQISKIESDVKRIKEFANNIPAVKESFREQSLQLEAVLESIPRTFEFNALLKICNQIALNSGVEILKFRPDTGPKDSQSKESYFKKASIELTLAGGFLPSMLFLDQMSKIKRLLSFREVQMVAKRNVGGDPNKGRNAPLDISIVLEAYSLGET